MKFVDQGKPWIFILMHFFVVFFVPTL